ncbi:MAG: ATPase domain-containing protein [archaeon]
MREQSGIKNLDKLIEGGFPKNAAILLIGPPGVGKSILCEQILNEGIRENEECIFVTFDSRPESIRQSMKRFGWNSDGKLTFLDCFSWRIGSGCNSMYAVDGLSNLNQLNMVFTDLLRDIGKKDKRLVADSISTLFLYSDPQMVPLFLQEFIAKSTSTDSTLFLTLEEGVHDIRIVSTLNFLADGLIEMKFEEDKRFLRISKMKDTRHQRIWVEYEITEEGIVLKI